MDKSAISRESPGSIIKIKRNCWGFQPNSLPPEFPIDWNLVRLISEAEREIAAIQCLINTKRLISATRCFKISESAYSLVMEGEDTSIEGYYAHIANEGVAEEDHSISRYLKALEFGVSAVVKGEPLNLTLIQDIHGIVYGSSGGKRRNSGEFRTGDGDSINLNSGALDFEFTPAAESQMKLAIYALDKYFRRPILLPPIVQAAFVYYQISVIRPFEYGNDLMARMLFSIAMAQGFKSEFVIGLSHSLLEYKELSVKAITNVITKSDWNGMIAAICQILISECKKRTDFIDKSVFIHDFLHNSLEYERNSAILPTLVDELFLSPAISTSKAAKLLKVSFRAAQLNIDKLVELGILTEMTGRKRNRVYCAKEIMALYAL